VSSTQTSAGTTRKTTVFRHAAYAEAARHAAHLRPRSSPPPEERLPTERRGEGVRRGRGREGCVTKRGGLRHGCAHLIRDGHTGQVPSRPPDHQLPVGHGHNVQRPNRELLLFATVCKSGVDEAELRRDGRRFLPQAWPSEPLAARRTRARNQDDRRVGPARLSSNAAARTRIRCGGEVRRLRGARCYGLRGLANGGAHGSRKRSLSAKRVRCGRYESRNSSTRCTRGCPYSACPARHSTFDSGRCSAGL
jgi:hypothetical protein